MSDRVFQISIAVIVAVALLLGGAFLWRLASPHHVANTRAATVAPAAPQSQAALMPGHTAALKVATGREGALRNGSDRVDVALNQRALFDLAGAAGTGNVKRYDAVFEHRRAFRVGDGTRVRILGEGAYSGHVEILTGASRGRTGFVPQEWVATQ